MAAVLQSPPRQRRLRSASDPFVDPSSLNNPPPLPPKSATPHPTSTPRSAATSSRTPADITEAVRDTVTVRPQDRSKMNRTTAPSSSNSRPGRRSQSEDSAHIVETARNGKPRAKKGSQHADVIDRLDFTGVGPMFHHDGPFDACAPSRNKHRNKAPLYAWGDDLTTAQLGGSAYPSAHAYAAFSNDYDYPDPPKKKVDALAEAWGIHEPEPFEDFSAGGGSGRLDAGDTPTNSIYNGRDSHSRSGRRPKDSRERQRRSTVPPPQPIFVEPVELENTPGSPPASPSAPKRTKSIMQRIRKMRDAPNVPVGRDYDMQPGSPTSLSDSSRPTHRPQNSFLGRLAGGARANQPTTDRSEPFVFIEPTREAKDLPPAPVVEEESTTPPTDNEDSSGYFDGQPAGGGLGRKTSLIKKMGKVVRAGAK